MRHIVDPLVDYITNFLKRKYNEALKKEKKNAPDASGMVTAHNSTVLVNSSMQGNISNSVTIDNSIKEDANALIKQIEEIIPEHTNDVDTEDIKEILTEIKDEIAKGNKPKKPLLIALKATGSALIKIAPLAIKLYEILTITP
jgi:hypothetical protein